jgi:hypothetical protein
MAHIIEPASSGRAKCRGCGNAIAKGDLRFGERLPNPFADDGDMTLWFHPICAAYKRPESLAEIIDGAGLDDEPGLRKIIDFGITNHRTQRINGAQRAPSGRAKCRSCRETIVKDQWRIPLVYFEDGMFNASGFVHTSCAKAYFDTTEIVDHIKHFATEQLSEDELADLSAAIS